MPDPRRKYALTPYTVEHRARGWYFGRPYDPPSAARGPYGSIASVTLVIARELRKELLRREQAVLRHQQTEERDTDAAQF